MVGIALPVIRCMAAIDVWITRGHDSATPVKDANIPRQRLVADVSIINLCVTPYVKEPTSPGFYVIKYCSVFSICLEKKVNINNKNKCEMDKYWEFMSVAQSFWLTGKRNWWWIWNISLVLKPRYCGNELIKHEGAFPAGVEAFLGISLEIGLLTMLMRSPSKLSGAAIHWQQLGRHVCTLRKRIEIMWSTERIK